MKYRRRIRQRFKKAPRNVTIEALTEKIQRAVNVGTSLESFRAIVYENRARVPVIDEASLAYFNNRSSKASGDFSTTE